MKLKKRVVTESFMVMTREEKEEEWLQLEWKRRTDGQGNGHPIIAPTITEVQALSEQMLDDDIIALRGVGGSSYSAMYNEIVYPGDSSDGLPTRQLSIGDETDSPGERWVEGLISEADYDAIRGLASAAGIRVSNWVARAIKKELEK